LSPELPRNIKLGQIRRTVGLLPPEDRRRLEEDERAAVDALSLHVWFRARQTGHSAFEGEDCVFLTVGWMQNLLRAVEARKAGEKTAAAAISFLEEKGLVVDTSRTKKPRRRAERIARAEQFQKQGSIADEGGKEAQPSPHHSYWWRLFRVPALTKVREGFKPLGAYGRFEDVPQHLASLSSFLRRQGLIPSRRAPSSFSPRSVQWVFSHSGPP
jgi:hypothetical protein